MDKKFEEWLATRPPSIRELAIKYPPDKTYRISDDAPYSVTRPKTIVQVMAYNENSTIRVVVMPENLLPEAVAHLQSILAQQGRDFHKEGFDKSPHSAYVQPKFLIPIENDLNSKY